VSRRDEGPFLVKLVSGEWVMAMIRRDTVSPTTIYLSHVLQIVERGPKVEFKQWCPLVPLEQTFVMNEFAVLTYLAPAPPLVESYNQLVGLVRRPTSAGKGCSKPPVSPLPPSDCSEEDKIIPLIPE